MRAMMKVRKRTMWPRVWSMMGCGGVGLLLLAGMAGAQPFPGGLPKCLASLHICHADLATCQTDLAACLAEPTVVFPGDGAGHGAALRYTDNMDGTATDNNTLLVWEVKDNAGGVHDVDNRYTWSSSGTAADGTLFTVFLDTLNNKCDGDETMTCTSNANCVGIGNGKCGHAGFRDWRLPHIKELQSIVDYGQSQPAIDSTFSGLIPGFDYWSSTEHVDIPSNAWLVAFNYGYVFDGGKFDALRGRAVRGGR
jgi:hypothetical protein